MGDKKYEVPDSSYGFESSAPTFGRRSGLSQMAWDLARQPAVRSAVRDIGSAAYGYGRQRLSQYMHGLPVARRNTFESKRRIAARPRSRGKSRRSYGGGGAPGGLGAGVGVASSGSHRPRTSFADRRWNRAFKYVTSHMTAPFIYRRVQPIADPCDLNAGNNYTFGLAPGFVSGGAHSSTLFSLGTQGYFVSPCMYSFHDIYDQTMHTIPYTGIAANKIMTIAPAYGLIPLFDNWLVSGGNAGTGITNASDPMFRYITRSAELRMQIANRGTTPIRIIEYKCKFRPGITIPQNLFTHSNDFQGQQLHLQLYTTASGYEHITDSGIPGTVYGASTPGCTPFKNKMFTKYISIIGVKRIQLDGGQDYYSTWRDNKSRSHDYFVSYNGGTPFCEGAAYFYLYTTLGAMTHDATSKDHCDYGSHAVSCMARVFYECVLPPITSRYQTVTDMRNNAGLVGAETQVNPDTDVEQTVAT